MRDQFPWSPPLRRGNPGDRPFCRQWPLAGVEGNFQRHAGRERLEKAEREPPAADFAGAPVERWPGLPLGSKCYGERYGQAHHSLPHLFPREDQVPEDLKLTCGKLRESQAMERSAPGRIGLPGPRHMRLHV